MYLNCIKFIVFSLIFLLFCKCNEAYSSYNENAIVPLYVNKIGPYYNPHETYSYYKLPFCKPSKAVSEKLSIGVILDRDSIKKSLYEIRFRKNTENVILCTLILNQKDINQLIEAIEKFFYFEFILDDEIRLRGFVGNVEQQILPLEHKVLFYTNHNFLISYNKGNVITGHIGSSDLQSIDLIDYINTPILKLNFTYSVIWSTTDVSVNFRHKLIFNDIPILKTRDIHWFSITNSLILIGFLSLFIFFSIGRILSRDFNRYNSKITLKSDKEAEKEESGWKIIHNDAFRPPQSNRIFFCAVIGTGIQMLTIGFSLVIMALFSVFHVHSHSIVYVTSLLLFSFTSWIAGFVGTRLYKMMENTQSYYNIPLINSHGWVRVVNVISVLYALPFTLVWFCCNCVYIYFDTTHTLQFHTISVFGAVWLFCGYPLTIAGGIFGRRTNKRLETNGCRIRNIPREIPTMPWYKSRWIYLAFGGILPFSSICIELHYIFSTIWGRANYELYGVLLIVLLILLVVTVFTTISVIYFQLINEDYRWWWSNFYLGGSSAILMFLYSIFFFTFQSNMSGFLQTFQYFSYSLLCSYSFFLIISAIAFFSSFCFTRFIYNNIKLD